MNLHLPTEVVSETNFELRFRSLFDTGRSYCFPCDCTGAVDLSALSDTARNNYLYSRAAVGRDLAYPECKPTTRTH